MEDMDGTFLLVDLETNSGKAVAIVPVFWFSANSCWYPPPSRKGNRAVTSREIPLEDWLNYPAKSRGIFGSFKEARKKLPVAEVLSDINIPSDAEGVNLGRGKRTKRPRVMYSPDSSEGEEEATLSRAPPIPPNLLRKQSSSFSPSNLQSNGLSVPNNNIANNSSTEHLPSVGYRHTVSPTSQHAHIVSSGNTFNEHGPSAQHAHPGSSNSISHFGSFENTSTERGSAVAYCQPESSTSYGNFGQSMNPSAENSSSVRYCYPGSSASYGYLGTSVNASTEQVLSVGHELEYSNPGSSTPFGHHGLSPSIAPPQSPAFSEHLDLSASIVRPGSSASIARPGSSASIVRPGSSASIVRPGSSASIVRLCFHCPSASIIFVTV